MDIDPHSLSTEDARAELEEAVRWFGELGDEAGLATTWNQLATVEFTPCRFDHAERAARKALDHARRSGEERLVSQALMWLVGAQWHGRTTPEERAAAHSTSSMKSCPGHDCWRRLRRSPAPGTSGWKGSSTRPGD
jgi:hypothetical protein